MIDQSFESQNWPKAEQSCCLLQSLVFESQGHVASMLLAGSTQSYRAPLFSICKPRLLCDLAECLLMGSSGVWIYVGWWGLARHFHYLPELLAAFCWTVPVLLGQCLPYFYVVFLTLLLTDRAFRDDTRCASKYGKYWTQYTKSVPYKMVPYVF